MKKLLAILLTLCIISQNMVNVGIGIYYHINKEYISKQLCENRNNPQVHCNGHCYLSKQLQKAEKGEKQSAQLIKEQEDVLVNSSENLVKAYFPSYSITALPAFVSGMYSTFCLDALIKPPSVA